MTHLFARTSSASRTIFAVFGFIFFSACPATAQNAIVTENALPGNPASEWDISGAGDLTIQGFATDISVNKGQAVHFKIKTDASDYTVKIYRLGYYQGNGARLIDTAIITATLPQAQPADLYDPATGLVDCGNWSESAHWDVPANAVSGIYIAKLTRTDNGGASHIAFIVRDDAGASDLIFQASDATWQAYNVYGGNSLYVGSTSYPSGHATKVSYNRPFVTRDGGGGGGPGEDWLFNAEYPMLRWLERNGYDVSYTTNVDADRYGALLLNHKIFLSVGHDEYWSAQQRANVEAARNAGVHLAFFSGNEVYWKTRWENSIDTSATPYRTLVCYKEGELGENVCGTKCDPLPNVWTGLWRDGCDYPSADGCDPENALTGQISWDGTTGAIEVPDTYKNLRFWRNTSIATLPVGQTATLSAATLGYEWDWEQYNASYPAGRIRMSQTVQNTHTHHLSLYRHAGGALVFGAGTVQWSWGLDGNHDRGSSTEDIRMQQATVNLFADMDVQPATLQAGLVPATASTDVQAPVSVIVSPLNGDTLTSGVQVVITGTASDNVLVAGVEVSVDGGATWQAVTGAAAWSFSWTPVTPGTVNIKSRAFDDSGNLETPGAGIIDSVSPGAPVTCPCSIFQPADVPAVELANDGQPIEFGIKFQSATAGYITGLRFYKGAGTTGTHSGHLWTSAGILLADEAFTTETASGWQEITLATPIAIDANTTYITSCFSSSGDYPYTDQFFTAPFVNGPLRALADGEDGPNGVYAYGAAPAFPLSTFSASNYYVDVVFAEITGPDTIAPAVNVTSPLNGATSVSTGISVTATFSEAIDPSTLSTATFELRDASSTLIPATISYNAAAHRATLDPAAPLAYSSTYTATVIGGTGYYRIKDVAGNALAADYSWSFTTAPVPPPFPTEGPGGPILLISSSVNPFSRYPVEILRAEGFNEFAAMDITAVNATVLNNYDVVIVGEIPLTPADVTLLTNWTNAGGTLIAFRPDAQLAPLMGITPTGNTLSDQYMLVNTASAPGAGIVNQVMQFHGTADLYTLSGATAVATLYSDAVTPTSYPAVTIRNVGPNGGQAVAFTYDLARSVVYTRQGNPAWAGQKRDGQPGPIRSDDQFFPDWIDLDKVAIPQADEQQHLLSNIIISGNLDHKPLPRFWFLPNGFKAAVVMTGDNHGDYGMQPRFDLDIAQSTAGCSVDDWECIRSTGYLYLGSTFTDSMARYYDSLGFEVALHVNTNCANVNASQYDNIVTTQMADFQNAYPSIGPSSTNRNHCIAWSDWSLVPEIEAANGIRFDVNYYYWPGAWINNRPGMFTGSGMPMRFAKLDGSLIDCYQAPTQMTDESGILLPAFCDSLLDKATGPEGYYGVFVTNMHFDQANHPQANAIVASAQSYNVPVVSAKQMLDWVDARNNSSFGSMTWNGNVLGFTITADSNARNMKAMLPVVVNGNVLISVTLNGSPVVYTQELIKGIEYAFIPAENGNYEATYSLMSALVITNVTATPGAGGTATITWTTNNAADSKVDYDTSATTLSLNASNASPVTNHSIVLSGLTAGTTYHYRVTSIDAAPDTATAPALPAAPLNFTMPSSSYCAQDETYSDFSAGTDTSTLVVTTADGEVILQPALYEEFTAASAPSGWSDAIWDSQPGAVTTYDGETVSVNGTHIVTNASFGPETSIEFAATFTTGNFQNVGYTADALFNSPWVVIGQGSVSDGNVYARTSDNESVSLGAGLLNAPHIYRIERNALTGSFRFYVDGALVPTPGIALTSTASMVVQASDYPSGGAALTVDWMKITPYDSAGIFTSRVFDGGDTLTWGVVTWTDSIPAGTSLSLLARGGNTAIPDGTWSTFLPLVNGTATGITSRYLQYKADMSTSADGTTPSLKDIRFSCQGGPVCTPPLAYISAADTLVCQGDAIQLQLDSATGQSPYTLVVNGTTYNNVTPGQIFTTAQPAPLSIWGSSGSPSNPNGNDGQPIEVGVKFRSSVNGFVKGVRFYKGNADTGTHTGSLWTAGGALLATAIFTSETASGWQEVEFTTPVFINSNTTYVASYLSAGGGFAITPAYFSASGTSNGPLTALQSGVDGPNGVYVYGGGFPAGGSTANYWVDVLFAAEQTGNTTTNFVLDAVTDNNGCASAGDSLWIASVTATPLPAGIITAGAACTGQDVYLTFNANSGAGPFDVVVNGITYNGVMSGTPFNTGIPAAPGATQTIWDSTVVPGTITANDSASIELGVKFRSDTAGKIKGIRFYKGPANTGTHTGTLWTASGVQLATATFTNETASGWQEVLFSSPVSIAANTTYIASYHTVAGRYSFDPAYFAAAGTTNGNLHALQNGEDGPNGVYKYAPGTIFPDNTFNAGNYWVDVVFAEADNTFTLSAVTNANGCSVQTGNTVIPVSPSPVTAVIAAQVDVKCKGEATGSATVQVTGGSGVFDYLWNDTLAQTGDTATGLAAGVYSVRVVDVSGCNDTTWAAVTITEPAAVLSATVTTVNAQCYNGNGNAIVLANGGTAPYAYTWSNATVNDTAGTLAAGTYWVMVTDANACIVSDTVQVAQPPAIVFAQALTICNGDSVEVGTNRYNAAGTYIDTLTAINGCDSTVTTALTVLPAPAFAQSLSVCNGDSVQVGNNIYTGSGTYFDTLTTVSGCDSTITTVLSVLPAASFAQSLSVCNGDSVQVGNNIYAGSGTYFDTLISVSGCDSTVTTVLSVLPAASFAQSLSVCNGGSVQVGNNIYTTSGTYLDTLVSANGCDSTVTTVLSVLPAPAFAQSLSVCNGGSVQVGNNIYTASGTYLDTLVSANGCDSTVTTVLNVLPPASFTQNVAICNGGSVQVGSNIYTAGGTYLDTLAAANGCDSTVTTILTVTPIASLSVTQNLSLCNGDSVQVGSSTYTASGTYVDVFPAVNGCDSTVTTILNVRPVASFAQNASICNGGSIQVGSNSYTVAGTYFDTLVTANGCDSTVTTVLAVLPGVSFAQNVSICNGGSIQVGSNSYTAAGTYVDTLAGMNGCDSTVTTVLAVLPVASFAQNLSICDGGSIQVGNNSYTASGTYLDTLAAANGCDSAVTTVLTVLPGASFMQNLTVCNGDSIRVGNNTYTASGIYLDTLTALNGCDSIITTDLVVLAPASNTVSAAICENDSLFAGGAWQTVSGIYHDTLITAAGCDSVLITSLTVSPELTSNQSAGICANDSIFVGGAWQYAPGTYYDTLLTQSGCDSIIVTLVNLNSADTSVTVSGDTLVANAAGTTFQWIDCNAGIPIAGATDSLFVPSAPGSYAVIVTENGCSDTSSCYTITDIAEANAENIFTIYPNPFHDQLIISITGEGRPGIRCTLYNVIGEQLINRVYENTTTVTLDLQHLSAGAYFLEISSGNTSSVVKVIKE